MNFQVITIFPKMIASALEEGVVAQAIKKGHVQVESITPRVMTSDFHKTVDDRPYGGGDGMVMLAEPLKKTIESLGGRAGKIVYLSPKGKKWSDQLARDWASEGGPITLICGRYGGVDERFLTEVVDEEVSIGDYILSGGELAALVLIDSVVRFLPEVLGNTASAAEDSFAQEGLLEAPLFTRPRVFGGLPVPEILLSGDHKKILALRRALQIALTLKQRPDLLTDAHRLEIPSALGYLKTQLSREEMMACGLSPQDLVTK